MIKLEQKLVALHNQLELEQKLAWFEFLGGVLPELLSAIIPG